MAEPGYAALSRSLQRQVRAGPWRQPSTARITGKGNIAITLQQLQVSLDGDKATAKFHQNYVASDLNTTTRKTLSMRNVGGSWRIVRESTGG